MHRGSPKTLKYLSNCLHTNVVLPGCVTVPFVAVIMNLFRYLYYKANINKVLFDYFHSLHNKCVTSKSSYESLPTSASSLSAD